MISIINYGLGNLGSIANILKKAGVEARISSAASDLEQAEKLILPGVGAFDTGMKQLDELGLIPVLNKKVLEDKIPILGVCLGMQLLGKHSEEGQKEGLGWIDAESIRFRFENGNSQLKIPHMGWNMLTFPRPHPLFDGLYEENRFYFVHSFHVVCKQESSVLAETEYGFLFNSAVIHENIIGVQFHPEKSHKFGMRLLKNFADWNPETCSDHA